MIILNKANQYLNVVKHQFYFIQYYFILSSTWIESSSFATKKEPLHTPTFAGKEINLQLISKKDFLSFPFSYSSKQTIFATFCSAYLRLMRGSGWKGNQVQVLNSPAAVSSIYPYKGIGLLIPLTPLPVYIIKVGRQVNRSKSEDLQNVKSSTVAFEERAAVRMRYLFINMFF